MAADAEIRPPTPSNVVRIAAAIVLDDAGRMLVVRKRGTRAFIQPGGKIEPGESPEAALRRELLEELGRAVSDLRPCGRFAAPAIHEAGHVVEADFFRVTLAPGPIAPAAEIEEVRWIDPDAPGEVMLAPLTAIHALPLARLELGQPRNEKPSGKPRVSSGATGNRTLAVST